MKDLFNNLFFGYFPYGWRRLFRTIMFFWFFMSSLFMYGTYRTIKEYRRNQHPVWDNEGFVFLVFGITGLMLLSYIITGFIKQKKSNL